MIAPMICIAQCPVCSMRSLKAIMSGLHLRATTAGMYSALRRWALPFLASRVLWRTELPDSRCSGARPA